MSEPITTTAPIPSATLKSIIMNGFKDEVVINVDESSLSPQALLTYLTNLGVTIEFHFDTVEGAYALIRAYMQSPMLHDFRQLEISVLELLMQIKGLQPASGLDYHDIIVDSDMRETITQWLSLVESLGLYASAREAGVDATMFPQNPTTDLRGINFVKLLAYDDLALVMLEPDPTRLSYYPHFFDKPVFKGSTLENYWVNSDNPVCVISHVYNEDPESMVESGELIHADIAALQKELDNVSAV